MNSEFLPEADEELREALMSHLISDPRPLTLFPQKRNPNKIPFSAIGSNPIICPCLASNYWSPLLARLLPTQKEKRSTAR